MTNTPRWKCGSTGATRLTSAGIVARYWPGSGLEDGGYVPIPLDREPDGLVRGYSPALGLELHAEPLTAALLEPGDR